MQAYVVSVSGIAHYCGEIEVHLRGHHRVDTSSVHRRKLAKEPCSFRVSCCQETSGSAHEIADLFVFVNQRIRTRVTHLSRDHYGSVQLEFRLLEHGHSIERFEDQRTEDGGACTIEGRIVVERNSQKGILVGKGGQRIKALGEAARKEMEALLGCTCHLRLTVHVDKDWRKSQRAVQRMGYGPLDEQ